MKIIQIGANSGNDDVQDFIFKNKNSIELVILVEPIPFIINNLKNQYNNINNVIIENIAISNNNDNNFILYYEENSNYEVSSFSKQHLLDHGCEMNKIKNIIVESITFNNLMEKYNLNYLDYLYIDTEGLDVDIIESIDFKKYKIQNLIFESNHTDGAFKKGENYNRVCNYLNNLGYTIENFNSLNTIAKLK
jgi:FkbM family methyltransferase